MELVVTPASIQVTSAAAEVPRRDGVWAAAPLQSSWAHALEARAHAFSWFHGSLSPGHASCDVASSGSSSAWGRPALRASPTAPPGAGAPASRVLNPFNAAGPPDSCDGPGAVAGARAGNVAGQASSGAAQSVLIVDSQIAALIGGARPCDAAPVVRPQLAGGDEIPSSRVAPASFRAAARDPVRLHIEQGADGLTVWIGLDAQPGRASVHAMQLTSSLLRAADLPVRIAAVYCNGARTYSNGSIPSPGAATRINPIEEQA